MLAEKSFEETVDIASNNIFGGEPAEAADVAFYVEATVSAGSGIITSLTSFADRIASVVDSLDIFRLAGFLMFYKFSVY